MARPTAIALIPARAGSKRVPGKNVRLLAGHPLLAYTIAAARESGVFDAVLCSTDSPETAAMAAHYGAEVPFLRPAGLAGDLSPDIEWIEWTLRELAAVGRSYDCFSILRPTSPFRQPETIARAWQTFLAAEGADSVRAVEPCKQHPGKMWVVDGARMRPLLEGGPVDPPWHSTPYQGLPRVHVQNASLEIAWSRVVADTRTIAGRSLAPFVTEGHEGFDVNEPRDWWYAEHLLATAQAVLPTVPVAPYASDSVSASLPAPADRHA